MFTYLYKANTASLGTLLLCKCFQTKYFFAARNRACNRSTRTILYT